MSEKTKVFVCCRDDKKGRCGANGGDSLRKTLKSLLASHDLEKDFKVKSTGCLGKCSKGIACQFGEEKPMKHLSVNDGQMVIERLIDYSRKKTSA